MGKNIRQAAQKLLPGNMKLMEHICLSTHSRCFLFNFSLFLGVWWVGFFVVVVGFLKFFFSAHKSADPESHFILSGQIEYNYC